MPKSSTPKKQCCAITKSTKAQCKKDSTEKGNGIFCSIHWNHSGETVKNCSTPTPIANPKPVIVKKIIPSPATIPANTLPTSNNIPTKSPAIKIIPSNTTTDNVPKTSSKIKITSKNITPKQKPPTPTWESLIGKKEDYPLISISWTINSPPDTAELMNDEGDSTELTEEQWESIVFNKPVTLKVLDFNHDGSSDEPFITFTLEPNVHDGSTVRHVLEESYRKMCRYGPDDDLDEWEQSIGSHVYFEGFSQDEKDVYYLNTGS